MPDKIYLGLTGSIGSGCSTLGEVLQSKHGFVHIKLSDEIKEEARRRNQPEERKVFQDIGNSLRETHGSNYLALKVIEKALHSGLEKVAFDGIRNIGEVYEFRKYPYFYLVAIDCSKDNRWERVRKYRNYNDDRRLFELDDKRDKGEGLIHGQQVLRCVEEADILFINEDKYPTHKKRNDEVDKRFSPFLGLITKDKMRNPSIEETMMTVASTLALHSHCIKRRVGAVLCDSSGYIISAAYNEVPSGQPKCLDKYSMCYRDFLRNEQKRELIRGFTYCPLCSEKLTIGDEDFICQSCKNDISNLIPSYKVLDKCRSLHAEETTILKTAHYEIDDSILYTTTFPCLQCAKRILHSGIRRVVYIDPYPEEESIEMLEKGNVKTDKFIGVKAPAYYKLFYPIREQLEKEAATVN